MKIFNPMKSAAAVFCAALLLALPSYAAEAKKNLNIGLVNFKSCVEQSKMGKQDQATFESMKKQMESILEEKEKTLNEIAAKFNDPDYLDSLSPEAETELKRKFRALTQELSQQQNQYYQTLNQANFKIIQKLTDAITVASGEVAKDMKLDLVLSEESCFFCNSDFDVSTRVVEKMDKAFEKEQKEKAAKTEAPAQPKR